MKRERGWLTEYDAGFSSDPDYVAEGMAIRLAEQVIQLMDQKGLSRAGLADSMGVSRAYITRVLNAAPNLTLRSIAAVAIALDAEPRLDILPEAEAPARLLGR